MIYKIFVGDALFFILSAHFFVYLADVLGALESVHLIFEALLIDTFIDYVQKSCWSGKKFKLFELF